MWIKFIEVGGSRAEKISPGWDLENMCFGFVSGHDLSRAVEDRKRTGLSASADFPPA
jgi:hypothetical protein